MSTRSFWIENSCPMTSHRNNFRVNQQTNPAKHVMLRHDTNHSCFANGVQAPDISKLQVCTGVFHREEEEAYCATSCFPGWGTAARFVNSYIALEGLFDGCIGSDGCVCECKLPTRISRHLPLVRSCPHSQSTKGDAVHNAANNRRGWRGRPLRSGSASDWFRRDLLPSSGSSSPEWMGFDASRRPPETLVLTH